MNLKVNYKVSSYNKENIERVVNDNKDVLNKDDIKKYNNLYQINKNVEYSYRENKKLYVNKIYIRDDIDDVEVVINEYKRGFEFDKTKSLYKNNYVIALNLNTEIDTKHSIYEKIYKYIENQLYKSDQYNGKEEEILNSKVIKGYIESKNIEALEEIQYEEFHSLKRVIQFRSDLSGLLNNFDTIKNMDYENAINFINGVGLNNEVF